MGLSAYAVWYVASGLLLGTPSISGALCTATPWEPERWKHLYPPGVVLPPAGVFCAAFCALFPAPPGLHFAGDCALSDVDECQKGLTDCDNHAHCENLSPLLHPERARYSCRCDPHFFVTSANGTGCERSGVEFTLFLLGTRNFDDIDSAASDVVTMRLLCSALAELLVAGGYTKAGVGITAHLMHALLLQGVIDYPTEFVREVAEGQHAGRGLWRTKLRLAMSWAKMPVLLKSTFMHNSTEMQRALGALVPGGTGAGEAFAVPAHSLCANDRARSCVQDDDCLDEAACLHDRSDSQMDVRSAGGSGSPIKTVSAGMQLLSVKYDARHSGWLARMRYSTENAGVSDVLYLSHVAAQPPTPDDIASFGTNEFPCLPPGPSPFQQLRDDSVCCLPRFASLYTVTAAFAALLAPNTTAPQALAEGIRACGATRVPPPTHTIDLVSSADYVTGPFARMARSHASLDTSVQTHGYRDVLLFLDAEDMRTFGGIEQAISGGYRLRFLVGMAQLRGLHSDRLGVAFSHTEVTSDVTQSYTFATSAQSKATFIKDVNIMLMQVRNEVDDSFVKFARVQLTLPAVTTPGVAGSSVIHASSARAVAAFSRDAAPTATYPCVDTYTGAHRARIDAMLLAQEWCAIQTPVCAERGGTGSVYYTFPLADGAWTQDDLRDGGSALARNLYLDFMLTVTDSATGKLVSTRVQTSTPINNGAVAKLCEESRMRDSIKDLLEIDLFLGLTDSTDPAAFSADLVQSLDVTRAAAGATHMGQLLSSRKANVLTMLIKADPALFEQPSYLQTAVEVEDMFTFHFLDSGKKAQVEALITADAAFKKVVEVSALSRLRLEPTDALLELCPMHATRGVFGCVTRIDVQGRELASAAHAIVDIAPASADDRPETYARAARWTQANLGESIFAANLGAAHAHAMATRFSLNSRYRRGFMISPSIPWWQTDMHDEGVASLLDIAQNSITAVMITVGHRHALLTVDPNTTQRRRVLLSDAAATVSSESPVQATVSCEITGINSNDAVTAAVCLRHDGASCRMFALQMMLAPPEYCLAEHALIAWTQRTLAPVLVHAGHGTVLESRVTSVIRPRFLQLCRAGPAPRRLLATTPSLQPASLNIVLSGRAVIDIRTDRAALQRLGVYSFRVQTSRDPRVATVHMCEGISCSPASPLDLTAARLTVSAPAPTTHTMLANPSSRIRTSPPSAPHTAHDEESGEGLSAAALLGVGLVVLVLAGCAVFYTTHANSTHPSPPHPQTHPLLVDTAQSAYNIHDYNIHTYNSTQHHQHQTRNHYSIHPHSVHSASPDTDTSIHDLNSPHCHADHYHCHFIQ